jgi:hypothetical protein
MTDKELQKEMAQIFRARRRERYIKRYIIGPLGAAILLLTSLKIIDLLPSRSARTVDISFSLECRTLRGDWYKILTVDVISYEKVFCTNRTAITSKAMAKLMTGSETIVKRLTSKIMKRACGWWLCTGCLTAAQTPL